MSTVCLPASVRSQSKLAHFGLVRPKSGRRHVLYLPGAFYVADAPTEHHETKFHRDSTAGLVADHGHADEQTLAIVSILINYVDRPFDTLTGIRISTAFDYPVSLSDPTTPAEPTEQTKIVVHRTIPHRVFDNCFVELHELLFGVKASFRIRAINTDVFSNIEVKNRRDDGLPVS